jgi:hypothetical protein
MAKYTGKYFLDQVNLTQNYIISETDTEIIYQECHIDSNLMPRNFLNSNIIFTYFYHYSKFVHDDTKEKIMLVNNLIDQNIIVDDEFDDDIYFELVIVLDENLNHHNKLKTIHHGYFESFFYKNPFKFETLILLNQYLYMYTFSKEHKLNFRNNSEKIKNVILQKKTLYIDALNESVNYNYHIDVENKLDMLNNIITYIHPQKILETKVLECPICLEDKMCEVGHFNCRHHLCKDCFMCLKFKLCMMCRATEL